MPIKADGNVWLQGLLYQVLYLLPTPNRENLN